jgi:hypothetical protein
LNGKSEAVGIPAAAVNPKQIWLGQSPVAGDLAIVPIKMGGFNRLALGIREKGMSVHSISMAVVSAQTSSETTQREGW